MNVNTKALAAKTYRALPGSGFSWHKAEYAGAVLTKIRDQAEIGGDDKSFQVATAALKAQAFRLNGRKDPNPSVDTMRLMGYTAALNTLQGCMSAPVEALLAKTAAEALARGSRLPEDDKLTLAKNFCEQMEMPMDELKSSDDFSAEFEMRGEPAAPTLLTSIKNYVTDVKYWHRDLDGSWR